jgi:hypothetical protein
LKKIFRTTYRGLLTHLGVWSRGLACRYTSLPRTVNRKNIKKNIKKSKRVFKLKKTIQNNLKKKTSYFKKASKCLTFLNKTTTSGVNSPHHNKFGLLLKKKNLHKYYVNLEKYKKPFSNPILLKNKLQSRFCYILQPTRAALLEQTTLKFRYQLGHRLCKGKKRRKRMLRKFRILRKRYKYGLNIKELHLTKRFVMELYRAFTLKL